MQSRCRSVSGTPAGLLRDGVWVGSPAPGRSRFAGACGRTATVRERVTNNTNYTHSYPALPWELPRKSATAAPATPSTHNTLRSGKRVISKGAKEGQLAPPTNAYDFKACVGRMPKGAN